MLGMKRLPEVSAQSLEAQIKREDSGRFNTPCNRDAELNQSA